MTPFNSNGDASQVKGMIEKITGVQFEHGKRSYLVRCTGCPKRVCPFFIT